MSSVVAEPYSNIALIGVVQLPTFGSTRNIKYLNKSLFSGLFHSFVRTVSCERIKEKTRKRKRKDRKGRLTKY